MAWFKRIEAAAAESDDEQRATGELIRLPHG
jgi:hypothetical protein